MKKSIIVLVLFLFVWVGSLILLTGLDVNNLFLYLPRWLFYLAAGALLLPFVPGKYWPLKTGLTGLWLVWLLLLPALPWNSMKSFYLDCARIQSGMTLTQARQIMAPYVETDHTLDTFSAYLPGVNETPDEHRTRILFIPTATDSADWCVVYPKEDKVAAVIISPD